MADKEAAAAPPRPSMADVGRLANVSAQTVSRYFTGSGYVRTETRERIAAAIKELGYIPNQSARNLRTQQSHTVGVLSMGALNYGGTTVLTGLGAAAREAGITLIISQLDLDFEAREWHAEASRTLDHFLSAQVDGIVISTVVPGIDDLLKQRKDTTPILTVAELPDVSAGTHSRAAGYQATQHLITLGHTRIAHVAGPITRNETIERENGYRAAMADAGLTPYVISGATDWTAQAGYQAGVHIDESTFTAVFASNDELALGFMSALEQRGKKAPTDYSIIGIDDMPEAAYFSPPLTSMRMDFRQLGIETFRMLLHQIRTGERTQHYIMEPELIVRASTASLR